MYFVLDEVTNNIQEDRFVIEWHREAMQVVSQTHR